MKNSSLPGHWQALSNHFKVYVYPCKLIDSVKKYLLGLTKWIPSPETKSNPTGSYGHTAPPITVKDNIQDDEQINTGGVQNRGEQEWVGSHGGSPQGPWPGRGHALSERCPGTEGTVILFKNDVLNPGINYFREAA